jgi:hypothetical protein
LWHTCNTISNVNRVNDIKPHIFILPYAETGNGPTKCHHAPTNQHCCILYDGSIHRQTWHQKQSRMSIYSLPPWLSLSPVNASLHLCLTKFFCQYIYTWTIITTRRNAKSNPEACRENARGTVTYLKRSWTTRTWTTGIQSCLSHWQQAHLCFCWVLVTKRSSLV